MIRGWGTGLNRLELILLAIVLLLVQVVMVIEGG